MTLTREQIELRCKYICEYIRDMGGCGVSADELLATDAALRQQVEERDVQIWQMEQQLAACEAQWEAIKAFIHLSWDSQSKTYVGTVPHAHVMSAGTTEKEAIEAVIDAAGLLVMTLQQQLVACQPR